MDYSLKLICHYTHLILWQTNLHRPTVYELILSHGRTDVLLHYATIVGDYQRVIEHYVMNEEWAKAVDQLNRQVPFCSTSAGAARVLSNLFFSLNSTSTTGFLQY